MSVHIKTINGLPEKIKETQLYKNKRPSMRPVLLDKCNWIINSIVVRNFQHNNPEHFEPVALNKEIIRKQLGNKECDVIIRLLEKLDIICVDRTYLSSIRANSINVRLKSLGKNKIPVKARSMRYSLSTNAVSMGIISTTILSVRMEQKFFSHKSELLRTYLEDKQVHQKIIFNITDLFFDSKKAEPELQTQLMVSDEFTQLHYKECFETLKEFNNFSSIEEFARSPQFFYYQSALVKRVFHYYANIPRIFRKCLRLKDGSGISEIDLRNSQPLLLALIYHEETQIPPGELLEDVLNGGFYEKVAERARTEGNHILYDKFRSYYSDFKAEVLGQGLYFHLVPLEALKPAEKYLLDLYPDFMNYIRNKKQEGGYNSPSIEAQNLESDIFIRDFFILSGRDEFAVPIHDSLLVRTAEVDIYLNRLVEIIKNRFPNLSIKSITQLFTIKNY